MRLRNKLQECEKEIGGKVGFVGFRGSKRQKKTKGGGIMRLVSDNVWSMISKVCHVWEVEGIYLHTCLNV